MSEKIFLEEDIKKFCQFTTQYKWDLSGKPNIDEIRRHYNQLNIDIFVYPCIVKRETFILKDVKYNLGAVDVLFFYPNEYDFKEYQDKDFPIIYYIHGGGWVIGGGEVDHKLPRELCYKTKSIVIFPLYSLSPEKKYPIAVEQCHRIICQVELNAKKYRIDFNNLVVMGDSCGGNLTIATSLLSKQRNGPKIRKQVLLYPITDSNFNTSSYEEFKEGFYLTKKHMEWFFQQYIENDSQKNEILVSPNKANIHELSNLPDTLYLVGEFDPLKDEGLDFCKKLQQANVPVKTVVFSGAIHGFLNLKHLNNTNCSKQGTLTIINFIC